jgi:hypothetical protein
MRVARLRVFAAMAVHAFTPTRTAWLAAAVTLYALLGLMVLWAVVDIFHRFSWGGLAGTLVFYGYLCLLGVALLLLVRLGGWLKPPYRLAFFLALPVSAFFMVITWGTGAGLALLVLLGGLSTFAGSLASLLKARTWLPGSMAWLAIGAALLALGVGALLAPGADLNPALAGYHMTGRTLDLPDPGRPGPYAATSFTYGPGTDRWRTEYGRGVRLKTPSVDGTKLDARWSGLSGMLRSRYWGFDAAHLPVQGRVWMPQGEPGPFPLVLIVHGNHNMSVASDAGYAYLGEHLATQGFICASVDEIFLNSGDGDQINPLDLLPGKDIPVRAWLLLEHLGQWRIWAQDPGSPLHGQVDMEHIALIGHSRGGEAVALASLFNDLEAFPEDATVSFDFHFHLRGIAAIAPSDNSYRPRSSDVLLRNRSYFAMAGSLDGDVTSFLGSAQYSRADFSGAADGFKASLYIKDANHGQFNTEWGRNDSGIVYRFLIDERPIISGDAQRRIAKAYLSAFLDITLKGQRGYLGLFRDARNGAAWLPDDFMVSNYTDAQTRWLADYAEDADPLTGSDPAVVLSGEGLSVWREGQVSLRQGTLNTHVVYLAWDERMRRPAARYRISFRESPQVSPATELVFSVAQAEIDTLPEGYAAAGPRRNEDLKPLDWTLLLTDSRGQTAALPLSHDQVLYPQLRGDPHRAGISSGSRSDIVLRRFSFPLRDFLAGQPQLDLGQLREISFLFDRSPRGAIALDDVGFASE